MASRSVLAQLTVVNCDQRTQTHTQTQTTLYAIGRIHALRATGFNNKDDNNITVLGKKY